MKNVLRIMVLIAVITSNNQLVSAQPYQPFPTDSAVWSIYEMYDVNPMPPYDYRYRTHHYGMYGDSLVNGTLYEKMYINYEDSLFSLNNSDYIGLLREDSMKNIFFLPKDSLQAAERKIYDFTITKLNDTVYVAYNFYLNNLIPTVCRGIDTIDFFGITRKVYTMEYIEYYKFDTWIEGIGSTTDLVYRTAVNFESLVSLSCFHLRNELLYQERECYLKGHFCYSINELNQNNQSILLFPNPVKNSEKLYYKTSDEILWVRILDIYSNVIIYQGVHSDFIELSNHQLKNKLYFIEFELKNKQIVRKKLIIN